MAALVERSPSSSMLVSVVSHQGWLLLIRETSGKDMVIWSCVLLPGGVAEHALPIEVARGILRRMR